MTKTTGAEQIRWDLSELFNATDDPKIEETLQTCQERIEKFGRRYRGKLADLSPAGLAGAYDELIELLEPLYLVNQYASLVVSVDNANEPAKALQARAGEMSSILSNQIVFFSLELGKMPEDAFRKFEGAPELKRYAYNLSRTRETAQYDLSEKEEQVINLKNLTGKSAFNKMYAELTASFQFEFEIDGEIRTLSGSEMRALRQHPDKDVRRRAMKMFLGRYHDNKIVLTHVFNSIFKDYSINKDLRGYASPVSVMNIGNDLDDQTVETLKDATTDSTHLVQRYYKLKARMLDLDDMTLADIYAPLPESSEAYSWDDAKNMVLDAFGSFDDDFHKHAKMMFDEKRIDAPVVPNKRGGAYCSYSTPLLNPYVFLNYTGKARDVATMAHELGHAIHGILSRDQHLFNFHPILPLAETASVFSEMVLTDRFLKNETNSDVKKSLLATKLEDIFSTSHRQNMFNRFELAAHDTIGKRIMSSDEFCDLYESELAIMFGDSVEIPTEFRWEWSSIPHMINVPFYVYAYNFANLLVLALYQQYLNEGAAFIPKFKKFLSMGSSAKPTEIAAIMGQDISDPGFWNQGFTYIEGLINQLEQLI